MALALRPSSGSVAKANRALRQSDARRERKEISSPDPESFRLAWRLSITARSCHADVNAGGKTAGNC